MFTAIIIIIFIWLLLDRQYRRVEFTFKHKLELPVKNGRLNTFFNFVPPETLLKQKLNKTLKEKKKV